MKNVKCLIFDMDGLMFDSEAIAKKAYKKAAKKFGYDITDDVYHQLLGRSRKDSYLIMRELVGDDYPAVEISHLTYKYKNAYIEEHGLPMKKGLIELLDYAKQREMLIAIASSSDKTVITWYLQLTGIAHYFDYIISGDQVAHSKPNPEIFLNVCDHLKVKPEEALVLEDSKSGIMAAVNGNIPVICIPDILDHEEDIKKLTYHTLPDLLSVINVL